MATVARMHDFSRHWLISGRRGGIYHWGWLWGRANLSLSLCCQEKTLLCPHSTSCGQPLWLPILHHACADCMLIIYTLYIYMNFIIFSIMFSSPEWLIDFVPDVYFKVIPAKSSGTIHVSFTPLTLSGSAFESRCVGLALGFLSLDSEVIW